MSNTNRLEAAEPAPTDVEAEAKLGGLLGWLKIKVKIRIQVSWDLRR